MFSFTGLSFKQFSTGKNISGFGTFDFDYANIKGSPNGRGECRLVDFCADGHWAEGLTVHRGRASFLQRTGRGLRTENWVCL